MSRFTHYIDVTLLPGAELTTGAVMSSVFDSVHGWIANLQRAADAHPIAVAFPRYVPPGDDDSEPSLGDVVRVFGDDNLSRDSLANVLRRFEDYVHITRARPCPQNASHVRFRRYQPKSSSPRRARRYAKRHGLTEQEALSLYKKASDECSKLPYFNVRSGSSGHGYRVFVQREFLDGPEEGAFNTYGLSATATVPSFP